MKHGNEFYMQVTRLLFNEEPYLSLSNNVRLLYMTLKELEQRYTNGNTDWFYRSNEDLAKDMRVSLPTLKKAKAELLKTDLIKSWQIHFSYGEGDEKKLSSKHVSAYRILK